MRNVARYIPAAIWLGLLTYGSLIPAGKLDSGFLSSIPYWDKLVHFGGYLGSVFLVSFAMQVTHEKRKTLLGIVLIVIVWSVILEYLQLIGGRGRSFEVLDIIANISGALSGAVAFILLFKRRYYGS